MRYTQKLEDALFEIDDTTDVAENVLLFLNNSESFRDFGEGLSTLIKKYIPDITINDIKGLYEKAKEQEKKE